MTLNNRDQSICGQETKQMRIEFKNLTTLLGITINTCFIVLFLSFSKLPNNNLMYDFLFKFMWSSCQYFKIFYFQFPAISVKSIESLLNILSLKNFRLQKYFFQIGPKIFLNFEKCSITSCAHYTAIHFSFSCMYDIF